jgi:hypothetical protein
MIATLRKVISSLGGLGAIPRRGTIRGDARLASQITIHTSPDKLYKLLRVLVGCLAQSIRAFDAGG